MTAEEDRRVRPRAGDGSVRRRCCAAAGGACPRCERRFRELWQWRPHIERLLEKHAPDWSSAEDAIAETFLIAWLRLECVPSDSDQARGWLYRTARNCLANIWRRKAHQGLLAERLSVHVQRIIEAPVDTYRVELIEAFRSLPPEDQQILVLVGSEDLHSVDLAKLLTCSESAAAVRLHRARQRLTRTLARSA